MAKELGVLEIKESSYKNLQNKKQPKFLFTESQARVFIAEKVGMKVATYIRAKSLGKI